MSMEMDEKKNKEREALITALALISTLPTYHSSESISADIFDEYPIISTLGQNGSLLEQLHELKALKEVGETELEPVRMDILDAIINIAEQKSLAREHTPSVSVASSLSNLLFAPPRISNENKPDEETPTILLRLGVGCLVGAGVVTFLAISTQLYPLLAVSAILTLAGAGLMLTAYGIDQGKTNLWDRAFPHSNDSKHDFAIISTF